MKLVFCFTILTSLLYFLSLSPFSSPPFSNSWTIFPCSLFLCLQLSHLLVSHLALLSQFYPWTHSVCSPAPSFALLPTHFHFLFICERKSCLWAAEHQSLRDSLHLNTWKNLIIMTLDFGGIRRHNQTEWKIHEVSHTHMIMNIRTWGEHQSIEYLKWKEHVLYLGLKS